MASAVWSYGYSFSLWPKTRDKTNNIAHIEVHDMLNYDGRWCSYGTGMESIVNNVTTMRTSKHYE
ncbi:hypothetical protein M378DRAFT_350211 [Amanita muscaria Koide BX008]|uniref:Uncharacterized protein n=1 Tax=Amanita muscaria (strain Koide BX008) TaxID=946122 RepID=A0A0C2STU5_AMAMK|nr:hypothetical protein M378DRAFT_350211 [Amanita muscaria Koide BX008]